MNDVEVDCTFTAPSDFYKVGMAAHIVTWAVRHHDFERICAWSGRLPGYRPGGGVESNARRQSARRDCEMIGRGATTYRQHGVIRLIGGSSGKRGRERQGVRAHNIPGSLRGRTA